MSGCDYCLGTGMEYVLDSDGCVSKDICRCGGKADG
jgi:hypothetical protein